MTEKMVTRRKGTQVIQTVQKLEGSHQPAPAGGFPREQIHLAPGHGNYR